MSNEFDYPKTFTDYELRIYNPMYSDSRIYSTQEIFSILILQQA